MTSAAPLNSLRRHGLLISGFIAANLVCMLILAIVASAAVGATTPLATPRSIALADRASIVIVACVLTYFAALGLLGLWARRARQALATRGITPRRPPAWAFVLVLLPPIGVAFFFFHRLRELWRHGGPDTAAPRSLTVWFGTHTLVVLTSRIGVPDAGDTTAYALGALSPGLAAHAIAGIALATTITRLTTRIETTTCQPSTAPPPPVLQPATV